MDPGHFLTNSGSKIPMPRSKKENNIPLHKPKLTTTSVTTTNYLSDKINNLIEVKESTKVKITTNLKSSSSKSVPNVSKTSVALTRCKSGLSLKNSYNNLKRTAAHSDNCEGPATKQPKGVSKTGFPYKAKNWELKARLTECEEWVTDLRAKCNDFESKCNEAMQDVEEFKSMNLFLENEKKMLQNEINILKEQKLQVQIELQSKTESFDKLYNSSKESIEKMEILENSIIEKDDVIKVLQKEKDEFQNQLHDRDELIANLQNKLEQLKKENEFKTLNISDMNEELLKLRDKVFKLSKELCETEKERNILEENSTKIMKELSDKIEHTETLTSVCNDLKQKLCENEKLRRQLHNTVQDLKGNIRVFCRVRPPIQSEKENLTPLCSITFPDEGSLEISKSDPFVNNNAAASRPKFTKHEFSFDRVFNPSASQQDVFEELSQLVQSALDGYNVCVFAYGQTGSGKTYTMEGENEKELRGMIPRTVDHIFKSLQDLELIGWKYTVEVSFLEIYNEIIRDLLRNDKEGSSLKIMQADGKSNEITIPGLTVMKVETYEELDRLYLLAHQNRAVAYTRCNERSSRSHSVTRIKVTGKHESRGEKCYGSLYLVDLAGSERLNELMSDPRFREMKNINKSLSELGNVILGLLQKHEHIPYRNSKLTHLLQPALGGSSKTLMLVNISPVENSLQETLCSLRFAEKVNRVKTGVTKKRVAYDGISLIK